MWGSSSHLSREPGDSGQFQCIRACEPDKWFQLVFSHLILGLFQVQMKTKSDRIRHVRYSHYNVQTELQITTS